MVGGHVHSGKVPLTLFKVPLATHPVIVPQGKSPGYIDTPQIYQSVHNTPAGYINNVYGNNQAGLVQRFYRKQAPKTDALNRNTTQNLEWARDALPLTSDKTVLEVNAGTAVFGRFIQPFVKKVTASDVSRHMLKYAKEKAGNTVDTVIADTADLPFESESFDIVISRFGLNHFLSYEEVFSQLSRVVKTGGHVVIIERVPHPLVEHAKPRFDFLENLRDPSHIGFPTADAISKGLTTSGLVLQRGVTIFGETVTSHKEVHQEFDQYLDLTDTRYRNKTIVTQAVTANADYADGGTVDQVTGYQPFYGKNHKLYITETHALFIARK